MKQQTKVMIEARYQLTSDLCKKINSIVGCRFDNQSIMLDFIAPRWESDFEEDLLEIRVVHIGIEATGYVRASEVERLIGVPVKHLEGDYLAYLMTQTAATKGIHYQGYHYHPDKAVSTILLESVLTCDDWQVTLYVAIESLDIDDDYLEIQPCQLDGNLRLAVSFTPFETYLDTNEIIGLSDDDIVVVFPK
ncbi:MAG: hypothetical protein ACRC7J_12235 [Vibrio ordalii]|uniref:hypothetical protein n=1 Tax=Vibrio ordalii TaxID=28174 RepID=UPI003F373217